MKTIKVYLLPLLLMLPFVLESCVDKSKDTVNEVPDILVVSGINVTSFTATVSGSFNGLSKTEIALSKYGILYCEKSDKAADIFDSWKQGNNNPECYVYKNGKVSGESYSGFLTGLSPDTDYSFCFFIQKNDNQKCEISKVQSFHTLSFSPSISEVKMDSIHYFDAVAKSSASMDEKDLSSCSIGFLLSETADGSIDNGLSFIYKGTNLKAIRLELDELDHSSSYYCRLFIKYPVSSTQFDYKYGPVVRFDTKNLMEMAVDLNLPSGIMWADCDFGDYEFALHYDISPRYYWGSSKAMICTMTQSGNTFFNTYTSVDYEYLDKSTGNYVDLGHEISGTQYDAVKQKFGGKWRMPTKTDIEELVANCRLSSKKTMSIKRSFGVVEFHEDVEYYDVIANNGKIIKIRNNEPSWSGTMDNDNTIYALYCGIDRNSVPLMQVNTYDRSQSLSIRPVWDPNMPDE